MTLSNTIKKRFVKDYKLPIQVIQEPMFTYYIDELDEHFDTKAKLQMLTEVVDAVGGEDGFFKESNRVKENIINKIQAKEVYGRLQNNRLDDYNVDVKVKQQDIYNMGNVNHTFISIDLKHANFNVLKMFDPSLVLHYSTYEDLVANVTDFDYFKKSKYLRQIIFGNLLPKKQQKLQKWVMDKIINVLHTDVGINMADFLSSSSDEVVFAVDPTNADKFVEMVTKKLSDNKETSGMVDWFKVDSFTLKSVGDKSFFVKESRLDDSIEFKGIQSYFFMQVYKKYLNKDITEHDMKFYFEGFMATFDKSVFDEE